MYDILGLCMKFFIAIKDVIYFAGLFAMIWLFMKERRDLLNRIMAKDYGQYEYHDKMYEKDVKEVEKQRDSVRNEKEVEDEIVKEQDLEFKKEKEFLEKTDEDWEDEEIDYEKLRERIDK